MTFPYFVVDAFTARRFAGNAAAVVLNADALSDADMQAVAREFNLSETTFVLSPESLDGSVRFRWFSPTQEVRMCGHATIAGVHALAEGDALPDVVRSSGQPLYIDTLSGTLSAVVEQVFDEPNGRMIWLELPAPVLSDITLPLPQLARVLNASADLFDSSVGAVKSQDGDAIVFVKDVIVLQSIQPDFAALKDFQTQRRLRGLCVATTRTLTPSINVQSRFFAPAAGIDEDPVTGSVHGPLGAVLVRHGIAPADGDIYALRCTQTAANGRAGVVNVLLERTTDGALAARIGGQAATVMRGDLLV